MFSLVSRIIERLQSHILKIGKCYMGAHLSGFYLMPTVVCSNMQWSEICVEVDAATCNLVITLKNFELWLRL